MVKGVRVGEDAAATDQTKGRHQSCQATQGGWTADRATVLTTWAPALAPEVQLIKQLDGLVEDGETVALRIRSDNVSYPFFDAALDRRVVFVDEEGGLDADADWLVAAPGLEVDICTAGWRSLETPAEGWRIYRRVGLCPAERTAS